MVDDPNSMLQGTPKVASTEIPLPQDHDAPSTSTPAIVEPWKKYGLSVAAIREMRAQVVKNQPKCKEPGEEKLRTELKKVADALDEFNIDALLTGLDTVATKVENLREKPASTVAVTGYGVQDNLEALVEEEIRLTKEGGAWININHLKHYLKTHALMSGLSKTQITERLNMLANLQMEKAVIRDSFENLRKRWTKSATAGERVQGYIAIFGRSVLVLDVSCLKYTKVYNDENLPHELKMLGLAQHPHKQYISTLCTMIEPHMANFEGNSGEAMRKSLAQIKLQSSVNLLPELDYESAGLQ